eukprot:scaffold8667_cov119-Skeletonema_marinoi.AAC.3
MCQVQGSRWNPPMTHSFSQLIFISTFTTPTKEGREKIEKIDGNNGRKNNNVPLQSIGGCSSTLFCSCVYWPG